MARFIISLISVVIFSCKTEAQSAKSTLEGTGNDFINTLSESQKEKVCFDYESPERFNWYYIPRTRQGISLEELSIKQYEAAFTLLEKSLSTQGLRKVRGVIAREDMLRQVERRPLGDEYRDPKKYYFTVFGQPSHDFWGWRFEGHHLSLNFSSNNGVLCASTPTFFGANPSKISSENENQELLDKETELGFLLVHSLKPDQLEVAWVNTRAPGDIYSSNNQRASLPNFSGIGYPQLDEKQREIFLRLLDEYINNYAFDFAIRFRSKIENAGLDNLYFAWAGSLSPDSGYYYCIQGPMLLIEYDNTQDNANHIHTVVRDLTNDFGEDILKEHYKKMHREE